VECVRRPAAQCPASRFSSGRAPWFLVEARRVRLRYAPANAVRCIRRGSRLLARVRSALALAFRLRGRPVPAAGLAVHRAVPASAMFHVG
jgi:hypothetical protein